MTKAYMVIKPQRDKLPPVQRKGLRLCFLRAAKILITNVVCLKKMLGGYRGGIIDIS